MTVPDVLAGTPSATERTEVDRATGASTDELHRVVVVVAAILDGVDDLAHELAGQRRVLELVATRAAGHVPTGHSRAVVDRHPVVGHVVERGEADRSMWHAELGQTTCQPVHGGLELLDRRVLVVVVRVLDPLELVTGRLRAADEQGATHLRAEVLADVEVAHDRRAIDQRQPGGSRHGEHLLAQRTVTDRHVHGGTCECIEVRGVRARHIDDDRRDDELTIGEPHTGDAAIGQFHTDDLGAEPEGGAMVLCGMGDVPRGQHRVVDESSSRLEDGGQRAVWIGGEGRIVDGLRREVPADVERRDTARRSERCRATRSRCRPRPTGR